MNEEQEAMRCRTELLTVAEALRPSMPRVSDLMDDAANHLAILASEIERIFQADR